MMITLQYIDDMDAVVLSGLFYNKYKEDSLQCNNLHIEEYVHIFNQIGSRVLQEALRPFKFVPFMSKLCP